MWIKVHNNAGEPVYLNTDHIICFWGSDEKAGCKSMLWLVGTQRIHIMESPEEIWWELKRRRDDSGTYNNGRNSNGRCNRRGNREAIRDDYQHSDTD